MVESVLFILSSARYNISASSLQRQSNSSIDDPSLAPQSMCMLVPALLSVNLCTSPGIDVVYRLPHAQGGVLTLGIVVYARLGWVDEARWSHDCKDISDWLKHATVGSAVLGPLPTCQRQPLSTLVKDVMTDDRDSPAELSIRSFWGRRESNLRSDVPARLWR